MSILELQDHPSPYRKRILRWMFRNYPDLLRFYLFGGMLSCRAPIVGKFLARPILNNYGRLAHGGMALPLREICDIIDQAHDIVAAECPCRALENTCDLPRSNCLKLNTAGRVLLEDEKVRGRRISKEEAKNICKESYALGMMLQLEWCISPFHYDICCCCRCCCVAGKLRFQYGVDGAVQAGPYLPKLSPELCIECGECAKVCPAEAVEVGSHPVFHIDKCVGCGLCESRCPTSAIEMTPAREIRKRTPPPSVALFFWWFAALFVLIPEVLFFNFIYKRPARSR